MASNSVGGIWGHCRSVGQSCKLKADERSEGSLKETAAVPQPPPSASGWTDMGQPNSKPGLSRISVLFSPSPG
ncbi:hypothetical protein NQZ68_035167, partial [Scomber scombrus]